jgi:signal transduction histidine kinase
MLISRPGEDLWPCVADPSQINDAILNLAINARDAMPGGGMLAIETNNAQLDEYYAAQELEVVPGDYVQLTISDTETGMPPEVLDHVFEPFFTTKEQDRGTGLGLSMVYGFAKGHIKIYSEVGRGTSVRIYLPCAVKAEAVSAKARGAARSCRAAWRRSLWWKTSPACAPWPSPS